MADQVGSGTVGGAMDEPAGIDPHMSQVEPSKVVQTPNPHVPFHGRPVSWVAITIIILGFILGGVALVAGTIWWLFWTGAGVVVVGGIVALSGGIFNDWY